MLARFIVGAVGIAVFATGNAAQASETVTYSYDALGRLVASSTTGGPNAGVAVSTAYDSAGNRSNYTVSGGAASLQSPSPPAPNS